MRSLCSLFSYASDLLYEKGQMNLCVVPISVFKIRVQKW